MRLASDGDDGGVVQRGAGSAGRGACAGRCRSRGTRRSVPSRRLDHRAHVLDNEHLRVELDDGGVIRSRPRQGARPRGAAARWGGEPPPAARRPSGQVGRLGPGPLLPGTGHRPHGRRLGDGSRATASWSSATFGASAVTPAHPAATGAPPRGRDGGRVARAREDAQGSPSTSTCTATTRRTRPSSDTSSGRRTTNTTWDAARFEVCAHRWVHVSSWGRGYGVGLANDATYGHDVTRHPRAGGGTFSRVRLSLLRAPLFPDPPATRPTRAGTSSAMRWCRVRRSRTPPRRDTH